MDSIIEYFDELFPEPRCELNYDKDYELLIAVMLSAQTTDKRVNMVTKVLFEKYPTLEELADASLESLIDIIRPIGTFQRKAQNIKEIAKRLLLESSGKVPNNRYFLESLSGVGRKTANVVLNNLYGENCIAVDTHVSRVSKRLGIAGWNDNVIVVEKKIMKIFPEDRLGRLHHQFVLFGRYYCKAVKPECEKCRLKNICTEKQNNN